MDAPSVSPPRSGSFSGSTSSTGVQIEPAAIIDEDPRERILQGSEVVVRMDPKSILRYIMNELGSASEPFFQELDAGENGFKYSVKLDVSGLHSVTGLTSSQACVVGDPSFNRETAETKAALKAMKYLHEEHLLKVLDFSSRVAHRLEGYNTHLLVTDGMRSLEKVFSQWQAAGLYLENFSVSLEGKEWDQVVFGELTDKGQVFSLPSGSLTGALAHLDQRTTEVRSEMNGIKSDLSNYQDAMALKAQRLMTQSYYHTVDLSPKEVLEYVLSFFQLDDAKFSVTPGNDSFVHCKVELKFPEWDIYKYGGPIDIIAQGSNFGEAYENGALEALLFIEKHFPIKIVDCNYSKRKKATKEQSKLVLMMSRILQLGDDLKKLWSELNNEISAQHALFSLEPTSLFSGPSSQAQIEAFNYCANGINDVVKYLGTAYGVCSPVFEMMAKFKWQLLLLKISMHK